MKPTTLLHDEDHGSSPEMQRRRQRQKPKPKPTNPLQAGIVKFLSLYSSLLSSSSPSSSVQPLPLSALPKRYTLYPPLLLLPANFGSVSKAWGEFHDSEIVGVGSGSACDDGDSNNGDRTITARRGLLWKCIAEAFGREANGKGKGKGNEYVNGSGGWKVTHIAFSAPIEREVYDGNGGGGGEGCMRSRSCAGEGETISETPNPPALSILSDQRENIMRAPLNLRPVYGDFGPDQLLLSSQTSNGNLSSCNLITAGGGGGPRKDDFAAAFWTSTSVPLGDGRDDPKGHIVQVWAPRWTMFSRGNVREKTRILNSSTNGAMWFPGLTEAELGGESLGGVDVVDFYVGIGYFAGCFIAGPARPGGGDKKKSRFGGDGGVKRVWGWDVNGWSIEGLRRGCEKNGWGCVVVRVVEDETGGLRGLVVDANGVESEEDQVRDMEKGIETLVERIALGDRMGDASRIRCVAFWGDNKFAPDVLDQVERQLKSTGSTTTHINIRHANLGLLPTSRLSWHGAVQVLSRTKGGWLHVHENVDVRQIEDKSASIVHEIHELVKHDRGADWTVECDHVEQVKTYAPGVMHCVFDIKVLPVASSIQ